MSPQEKYNFLIDFLEECLSDDEMTFGKQKPGGLVDIFVHKKIIGWVSLNDGKLIMARFCGSPSYYSHLRRKRRSNIHVFDLADPNIAEKFRKDILEYMDASFSPGYLESV